MNGEDTNRFWAALEATWPPASRRACPPFILRQGQGGGSRVSAATTTGPASPDDIARAEDEMRSLGQTPLFRLGRGEEALDAALEALGYRVLSPTRGYITSPGRLASALPPLSAIPCDEPLAVQREIWGDGGVGPPRLAVMARVSVPKSYLLGRSKDRPLGTAFVAIHDGLAMLHALEIRADARRKGIGRALTVGAANWACAQGADSFGLLVTDANVPANALYTSLGMARGPGYHYRIAP